MEKKSLQLIEIGDFVRGEGGHGEIYNEQVTNITVKFNEDTGIPFKVIWVNDLSYNVYGSPIGKTPKSCFIRPTNQEEAKIEWDKEIMEKDAAHKRWMDVENKRLLILNKLTPEEQRILGII